MALSASIYEPANLEAVRVHLERSGYIAVLHWRLGGAQHPTPLAFSDFEAFYDYLRCSAAVGDAIDVWAFPEVSSERIAQGTIPDAGGLVHKGGAY